MGEAEEGVHHVVEQELRYRYAKSENKDEDQVFCARLRIEHRPSDHSMLQCCLTSRATAVKPSKALLISE